MEKARFRVYTLRFIVALVTLVAALLFSVCFVFRGRYGSAIVFLIIGVIFIPSIRNYGSIVTLDDEGVELSFLGKVRASLRWDEIASVGVAGSKIFHGNKNNVGTLFIYFSSTLMDDDDIFDMMLKFPPKDKIYLEYTKEAINSVQLRWRGRIRKYNTGDTLLYF